MVTGKRRPTRAFAKAVAAAFGIQESDFMPPFLLTPGVSEPVAPLLSEVPGKPGVFRVYIDREMDLRRAMKIIAALEEGGDEPPRPSDGGGISPGGVISAGGLNSIV